MEQTFDLKDSFNHKEEIDIIQLVGLKLGDEKYAIDVLKIQEIIRTVDITIVPRLAAYVLGVMNLRGKVIPVIDLRIRFNMASHDFDESTRIIVVSFDKDNVGFVVDAVTAVIRITKDMVDSTPPLVGSVGQEYILGICNYEDSLVMLLDIDRVIGDKSASGDSDLRKILMSNTGDKSKQLANRNIKKPDTMNPPKQETVSPLLTEVAPEPVAVANPLPVATPEPVLPPAPIIDIDQAIAAELAKREQETEKLNIDKRSAENGTGSTSKNITNNNETKLDQLKLEELSLDEQIAAELSKREEETDQLNSKKRSSPEVSVENIVLDAISQSDNNFKNISGDIAQSDLDSLIKQELDKREQETDQLNKKHRADKEKKN